MTAQEERVFLSGRNAQTPLAVGTGRCEDATNARGRLADDTTKILVHLAGDGSRGMFSRGSHESGSHGLRQTLSDDGTAALMSLGLGNLAGLTSKMGEGVLLGFVDGGDQLNEGRSLYLNTPSSQATRYSFVGERCAPTMECRTCRRCGSWIKAASRAARPGEARDWTARSH